MLQIEVIGNIGNDAEIKDFSGKKYVAFNVAIRNAARMPMAQPSNQQHGFPCFGTAMAAV